MPCPAEIDFLAGAGGERLARPRAGDRVTLQGESFEWFTYRARECWTNPDDAFGTAGIPRKSPRKTWRLGYFCCILHSDAERDVRLWPVGINYHLWANGRAVFVRRDFLRVQRAFVPNNECFPLRLRKGANVILLKTAGGHFEIAPIGVRVTDARGGRARGVCVLPDRPGAGAPTPAKPIWPFPRDRDPRDLLPEDGGVGPVLRLKGADRHTLSETFEIPHRIRGKRLLRVGLDRPGRVEGTLNGRALRFEGAEATFPGGLLVEGANRLALRAADNGKLRWAQVALAETTEREGASTVYRVGAGRFVGEGDYALVTAKETTEGKRGLRHMQRCVWAPACARFVLDTLRRPTDSSRVAWLLHVRGARYAWPWTREVAGEPDASRRERTPALTIRLNGSVVSDVRQPGGVNHDPRQGPSPFYQGHLVVEVPQDLLRLGVNTLAIERDPTVEFDARTEPVYGFELRAIPERHGQFTRTPRVAHAGRRLFLKMLCLRPDTLRSVTCGRAVRYLDGIPRKLEAGENVLEFEALEPAADVAVRVRTDRGAYAVRIPFIAAVSDPDAITFQQLVTVTTYTGAPEGLRRDLEIVRDLELGNSVAPRSLMHYLTPAKIGRRLAQVMKDVGLFVSTHWHIFRDYTRVDLSRARFDQKDLDRWTGGLLLRDGTRRPDPDPFHARSPRQFVKRFVEKLRRTYGGKYRLAFHTNQMWYRYGAAAGAVEVWDQIGYPSTELALAAMRGTARAYDITLGCSNCEDCAFVHDGSVQERRIIELHDWLCFMGGCTDFFPEGMQYPARSGSFLPHGRGYDALPYSRRIKEIATSFWDFLRTRDPWDGPRPTLGYALGRFDLWCARHKSVLRWNEGRYEPGSCLGFAQAEVNAGTATHWPPSAAEAGYELLDVAYPGIQFAADYAKGHPVRREHWFQPSPFGKADLVPEEAPLEKLVRYPALLFVGWNSATQAQLRKLTGYVRRGGTLFMAVPHLSAAVERDRPLQLVHGGDVRDLFGVWVKGRGREIRAIRERGRTMPLKGHPSREIRLARTETTTARALWVDEETSQPALVENRVGKGRALLLTLWNYPGEEKLLPLMRRLIRALARRHQGPVRFSGARWVNYSVFTRQGRPGEVATAIYYTGMDWWETEAPHEQATLRMGKLALPVTVPRDDLAGVVWRGDLALAPRDKMVFVENIEPEGRGIRAVVQGRGDQDFRFVLAGAQTVRVCLDGRRVPVRRSPDGVLTFRVRLAGRHALTFSR